MLKDTLTIVADEIAGEMYDKYMGGSNNINVELTWVVYALSVETGTEHELIKRTLVSLIQERFAALRDA